MDILYGAWAGATQPAWPVAKAYRLCCAPDKLMRGVRWRPTPRWVNRRAPRWLRLPKVGVSPTLCIVWSMTPATSSPPVHPVDQLRRCDKADLRPALHAMCAPFGKVARMDVMLTDRAGRPQALFFWRMDSPEQEQRLMREWGVGRFGGDLVMVVPLDEPGTPPALKQPEQQRQQQRGQYHLQPQRQPGIGAGVGVHLQRTRGANTV